MYLDPDLYTIHLRSPGAYSEELDTLLEKGSGEVNEDVLVTSGNLYGVFDGATSLGGQTRLPAGYTGGLLAARLAAATFAGGEGSLTELAAEANRRIGAAQVEHGVDMAERHTLWSTSMAVVRQTGSRLEYVQTGDAQILLVLEDGGYRLLTRDPDIDRETLQLWQRECRRQSGTIQEVLGDTIKCVRNRMNISYGVLNGEPKAVDFFHSGVVQLDGVTDIVLFTDGLFLPRRDPAEPNSWVAFTDLYRRGGLPALRDRVRSLQESDPQLERYPRFKIHDDIAAIAIRPGNAHRPSSPNRCLALQS